MDLTLYHDLDAAGPHWLDDAFAWPTWREQLHYLDATLDTLDPPAAWPRARVHDR